MLIQNFPHWKRHMLEGDKKCKDGVLERFLSIIRTYSASKSTALIKDPAAKSTLFPTYPVAKSILFSIYPAAKFTTFAIDHGTKPIPVGHANHLSIFLGTQGGAVEGLLTLVIPGTKCIKNR
jgi:hypothetical protein